MEIKSKSASPHRNNHRQTILKKLFMSFMKIKNVLLMLDSIINGDTLSVFFFLPKFRFRFIDALIYIMKCKFTCQLSKKTANAG